MSKLSLLGRASLPTFFSLGVTALIPLAVSTQVKQGELDSLRTLTQVSDDISAESQKKEDHASLQQKTKNTRKFPKVIKFWGLKDPNIKKKLGGMHTKNLNCCNDIDMDHPKKGLQTKEVTNYSFSNSKEDSYFLFLQFSDEFNQIEDFLSRYADEWVKLKWENSFIDWPIKWTALKTRENNAVEINFQFFSDSSMGDTLSPKLELPENGTEVFVIKFPKTKLTQLIDE